MESLPFLSVRAEEPLMPLLPAFCEMTEWNTKSHFNQQMGNGNFQFMLIKLRVFIAFSTFHFSYSYDKTVDRGRCVKQTLFVISAYIQYTRPGHFIKIHLFHCLFTLKAKNQLLRWQQLTAFRHVDVVKMTCQSLKWPSELGRKVILVTGNWCQKCWSEHFRNCWSTGIFMDNHL